MAARSNIAASIEAHRTAIARLEEMLVTQSRFGDDDDYELGTVLRFEKKFAPYGRVYTYAAIKTPVGWYVTGKNTSSWSWDTLVQFMTDGVDEVQLCTQAIPI